MIGYASKVVPFASDMVRGSPSRLDKRQNPPAGRSDGFYSELLGLVGVTLRAFVQRGGNCRRKKRRHYLPCLPAVGFALGV
jgi:hypothetical protein